MTVKIIAENQVKESHFLSATEQAGIYIGQPVADASNTGNLRPITSGDENGTITDFTYYGTLSGQFDLIFNPDFEQTYTAGLATSWSQFGAGQTYAEETTITENGRKAQRVTCVDDGETIGVAQSLSTTDTATYRIIASVYCNENTTVTIAHANLTGNSDTFAVTATTWTECVWEVVADASGAADLQIYRSAADSDVGDYIIIDKVIVQRLQKGWLYDRALQFFDTDSIIGAKIEFTSGTNNGETVTVTSNGGTSGEVGFTPDATDFTREDDTYTLTITAADLDFEVELLTSGDIGDSKFQWSFDSGDNVIGREYQMSGGRHREEISNDAGSDGGVKVVEMQNGNLICFYNKGNDDLCYKTSSDQGVSWSDQTILSDDDDYYMTDAIVLDNGRVMVFGWLGAGNGTAIFYSDDNADNWSDEIDVDPDLKCVIQLQNGNLLGFNDENSDIRCQMSDDGGMTWGSEVVVVQEANDQIYPTAVVAPNGNVVCAYDTDEDNAGDREIKCKISTDGGATWGSSIDVRNFGGGATVERPCLMVYPNGILYCFFLQTYAGTARKLIVYADSTDNGEDWDTAGSVSSHTTSTIHDYAIAYLRTSVVYGCRVWITYRDTGAWHWAHNTFRHREALTSLYGVVTAVNGIKQQLYCDVYLTWHGGSGVVGDKWTFKPKYVYAMENVIANSQKQVWRSVNDNTECNIILDAGANNVFQADGAAFFNCNIWDMDFEMHTANSWGTPDTDETVSFVLATGEVDSVSGAHIEDSSLLASYKDHALKGKLFMPTSGAESGTAYKIKDNQGDYIILDTTASHSISASDTFRIYQSKIAITFTEALKRYMRINIPAQQTPDGYYQIGAALIGKTISLDRAWVRGYSKTISSGVDYIRPVHAGPRPIKQKEAKRIFKVGWSGAEATAQEIEALFEYLEGRNLALIPDDSDMTDVYLCKITGDLELTQWHGSRFNFALTFEEI